MQVVCAAAALFVFRLPACSVAVLRLVHAGCSAVKACIHAYTPFHTIDHSLNLVLTITIWDVEIVERASLTAAKATAAAAPAAATE